LAVARRGAHRARPRGFTLLAFLPSQLAAEGTLTARPREVNLVLLLCAAAALSVPLAVSRPLALDALWETCLKSAVTFVLIVNIVRTERRLSVMLWLALAITAVLSVSALNDYRLGNLAVEGYRIEGKSTGGMFENTNDLGIHLVTMLPLAVALGLTGRGLLRKLIFGACAALILATVVVTFSRGAFLGLVASGMVLAWKFGRRHRLLVFGLLAVTVVAFLAAAPGEYGCASARSSTPASTASARRPRAASCSSARSSSRSPTPSSASASATSWKSRRARRVTHNSYTQVAAEMGLLAALLYTMFIVAPLKRLRLIERETFGARRASHFTASPSACRRVSSPTW
jgi:O-antigen ligase